jgi:hypothetical protein
MCQVKKGISQDFAVAISHSDLSSDHSQVLIPCDETREPTKLRQLTYKLGSLQTVERLSLNVSLKTEEGSEATVKFFNNTIQWAGWNTLPERTQAYDCPILKDCIKAFLQGIIPTEPTNYSLWKVTKN